MKIKRTLQLLGGVALAAVSLPAMAQSSTRASTPVETVAPPTVNTTQRVVGTPTPLTIGRATDGRITASDPRISDGEARYKLYSVTVAANTRLAITMTSTAENFDPYLEIGRVSGSNYEVMESNDDGGGDNGLNSRLVITLREAGRYVIRARSFGSDSVGAFTVKAEQLPPAPPPPAPIPISIGRPKQGQLTDRDAQIDDSEAHYRYYSFDGTAGQRLQIAMESRDFDSYLELGTLKDDKFEQLAYNDDAGGARASDNEDDKSHLNSRLVVRLRETGPYVIRARALNEEGLGAYTVSMMELPPAPPAPTPIALTVGRSVSGRLTQSSAILPADNDGIEESTRYYTLYSLSGRAGQTVRVTVNSPDFDTVLDAGGPTPIGYGVAATNDDAEGAGERSTDSRLTLRFDSAGTIILRVSALGSGSTGNFRIIAE